jgi:hypothetical protein
MARYHGAMRILWLLAAGVLVAAACGEKFSTEDPTTTTTTATTSTTPTGAGGNAGTGGSGASAGSSTMSTGGNGGHGGGEPPCSGLCGDVDDDGSVTSADVGVLEGMLGGSTAHCPASQGDLNADGELTQADLELLSAIVDGWVDAEQACQPCNAPCGDANQDNAVDISDSVAANGLLDTPPVAACAFWAADVNGDGTVDDVDGTCIAAYYTTGDCALLCAE